MIARALTKLFATTIFICIVSAGVFAQTASENLLRDLIKQTQQNSYYDSVSVFSVGNKALSLAKQMKNKSAEAELHIYFGNFYYYSQNFSEAKNYFLKAYRLAESVEDLHFQRLARIRMTYIASEAGNKEEAKKMFRAIIEESKAAADHTNIIEAINGLAIMEEMQNHPNEATKLYLEGLRIAEKNNLNYYRAVMLNNLGLVKLNNGQVEESLRDFHQALITAEQEDNLRLAFHALNNVGLALSEQDKNEDAIKTYNTTLKYAHIINHPRELATAYINIGFSLAKVEKIKDAILYYDSALTVLRENNMKYELSKGLLGKSDILIKTGAGAEAEKNIREAQQISIDNNDLQINAYCNLLLHRLRKEQKNYQEALDEYMEYKKKMDSLEDIKNNKIMKELQVQYDVEKKDNALKEEQAKSLILEKDNELEKIRKRNIIIIGLFLLLTLGIIFYMRYMRSIRKQQERFSQLLIENTEEERSRISKDLHDDIGQSLSVIKSRINIESRGGKKEMADLETEIGRIIEQTREISRSLYPSYLEKIGLVRSVARLMEKVQSSASIECSFDIVEEVETFPISQRTHLYRVIQECVNNTLKHAGASALKVTIENKNDNFIFTYMDNGKGLSNALDSKGIGFMSMKERARMLGGEMSVGDINGKGFRLMIKFSRKNFS
ncbi:MAG: tetratricopeptide repeat-containing sensor histidine kinase [Bacteroidota bacterium]